MQDIEARVLSGRMKENICSCLVKGYHMLDVFERNKSIDHSRLVCFASSLAP